MARLIPNVLLVRFFSSSFSNIGLVFKKDSALGTGLSFGFLLHLTSFVLGKDAVTWLTLNSPAKTRQEAVELGNRIMAKFVK
jgi:hypothetical protein